MKESNKEMKKNPSIKIAIFVAIFVIFFIILKYTPLSQYANLDTLKNSKDYLREISSNWWFPLLFILIYVIGVIISFSGLILTVAGGLIFGTIKGTLINVIASNIGASIAFLIGRYLGRDFVEKLVKGKLKSIDDKIEENGFITILRLRLIPIVPFNLLNYASGFSKVKYREYVLGSVIGMFPGTFIYTFFADAILIDPTKQKEAFLKLIIAASLLIATSFIPNLFKKIAKKPSGVT